MVTDPISDFIIRLKNAQKAGLETMTLPTSKIKVAIGDLLVKEGFIKSSSLKKKSNVLEIELLSSTNSHAVRDVQRISKPSRRVYTGADAIKPYKGGFGCTIISTPKGLLTDKQAIKEKVGGEVLFKIW